MPLLPAPCNCLLRREAQLGPGNRLRKLTGDNEQFTGPNPDSASGQSERREPGKGREVTHCKPKIYTTVMRILTSKLNIGKAPGSNMSTERYNDMPIWYRLRKFIAVNSWR